MTHLYIFDLDGTIALIEHRLHLIAGDKPNWDLFYRMCVDDKPNVPVVSLINSLIESGCDILIFSGRSDIVKEETINWLKDNVDYEYDWFKCLHMSPEGCNIPNWKLKKQWYEDLSSRDKRRLIAAFDDQHPVIDMWRDLGIFCFQVLPGFKK